MGRTNTFASNAYINFFLFLEKLLIYGNLQDNRYLVFTYHNNYKFNYYLD